MIETPTEIIAHYVPIAAAESFAAWRKLKKAPLTETAALRIAKTLADIVSAGGDASDALGMAEELNWQGIRASWYFREKSNEQRNSNTGPVSRPDTGSLEIAFAARANRTPSKDCF